MNDITLLITGGYAIAFTLFAVIGLLYSTGCLIEWFNNYFKKD